MTAQASDTVNHHDQDYALVAYSDGEPFVPAEHGYRPVMASTACYRGYLCEYAVVEDRLRLTRFHVNHQEGPQRSSQLKQPPALDGVEAQLAKNSFVGRWTFKDLRLPISYTGGIIIGRNFVRSLYVHMGFHPAWKYEHVRELIFEAGVLMSDEDLSERMATIRERVPAETRPFKSPSQDEVKDWIEESFRRDYTRKNRS